MNKEQRELAIKFRQELIEFALKQRELKAKGETQPSDSKPDESKPTDG